MALAAGKGDQPTAQLASQLGIHTSQVTARKKQLMAQAAELVADGRQRRADQATTSRNSTIRSVARRETTRQLSVPEPAAR